MRVTIVLELLTSVGIIVMASLLYVVLKDQGRAVALVALALWVGEAVFLTVKDARALRTAGAEPGTRTGDALLAVRDWTFGYLVVLAFLSGALMHYYVLFATRLIPRWLSVWGLAAVALAVVAAIYSASTQDFGLTTVNTVLNVPILLQGLVLTVWLIIKGFHPSQCDADHESIDRATPVEV